MKRISLLIVCILFHYIAMSQTDGISYQAVIIDNNPQEIPGVDIPSNNLPNVPLDVQFSIIDNTSAIEYQEKHNTTTDPYGMINLMIGHGSPSIGLFNQVYWDKDKFLKVEIDLHDGNGLVEFSYQELTYIPYVRHREIIATSTLDVDGVTNLNNSFNVNNASPSHLTGDLTVDENTNLNGTLTVFNEEPTLLTGDLTVEGLVSFDGELAVGGDASLYSDLTVEGTTFLNGDLHVLGQANFNDGYFQNITVAQNSNLNLLDVSGITNLNNTFNVNGGSSSVLSGNLSVTGVSTLDNTLNVNASSNLNGRVWIDANRDAIGGDLFSGAYPLRVSGSKQGIEIELTGNASGDRPNNGNNFVSFSSDTIRYGRIEGQTTSELTSSFVFVWYATQASLETAFQLAMVVVDLFGFDDGDAAIVEGIEMVEIIANWTGVNAYNLSNVGVSFSSGFGDYAEWLEKSNTSELFSYGDVVGVTGGKITKNTEVADHYMVISQNPIVLGNMQQVDKEKDFEKVAFMGQIPVKVLGKVNIGDYVIPSGLNDGIGRAISPNNLEISEYNKIVGVAWSESKENGLSLINLAVGINTNDTSQVLQKQQNEINGLKEQLNQITDYLKSKDSTFDGVVNQIAQTSTSNQQHSLQVEVSKSSNSASSKGRVVQNNTSALKQGAVKNKLAYQKILRMLEENPQVIDDILKDARDLLDAKGVDYTLFEQTNLLVTDKNYMLNHLKELIK